jgi:3-keto-disaccharide hydrolase
MRLLVRREFIATLIVGCVSVGLVRGDGFSGQRTAADLKQAGYVALFDGQTLGAWNVEPQHEGHWIVRDGVIHYDGKSTGKWHERSLWTNKSYSDFEMYVEWRLPAEPELKPHPIVLYNGDFLMQEDNPEKRVTRMRLDAGDSGLYFRGSTKCQANVWSQELGSGEINGYRTDKKMPAETRLACIPIRKADRPLGQWNAFLITIEGDEMTVMLNGKQVIDSAYLPDLPATGPIALQHHGDLVQFRQLWIREL